MGWLDDAGQILPNVLKGRLGAAGRKTLDLIGDVPDAILPYDLIPHAGDEDEYLRVSEVAGIDPMESPALAKITDIVGGAALNPLSYGAGPLARAGRASKNIASKGFNKLPDVVRKPLSDIGTTARRSLNWLDVDPEMQKIMDEGKGLSSQSAIVRQAENERIFSGLSPLEQETVGELYTTINRGGNADKSAWAIGNENDILSRLPDQPSIDRVLKAKGEFADLMGNMAGDANVGLKGNRNYFPKQMSGKYYTDVDAPDWIPSSATPSSLKREVFETPADRLKFLQDEDVDLEFNAMRAGARRSAEQARAQERAYVGGKLLPRKVEELKAKLDKPDEPERAFHLQQQLHAISKDLDGQYTGAGPRPTTPFEKKLKNELDLQKRYDDIKTPDGFQLTNKDHQAAVNEIIKDIAAKGDSDTAYKLGNFFNGVKGRKGGLALLATGNKLFKTAATFGIVLPRMSFNTGNRFSGVWQNLSTEGNRLERAGQSFTRIPGDLFGAVDDGLNRLFTNKTRWAPDELSKSLDVVDAASKAARGDMNKFRDYIAKNGGPNAKVLQDALDDGVLTGFVDSEQLTSRMARTPWNKKFHDIMEWPADIAKGVEQRMRLGTYMDIRKGDGGTDVLRNAARQTTKDTYLDYDVPGVANRTFRDIVPFGAFLSQNVKQQAKFLADKPFVATGAAPLFTSDDGSPKYPWMENQLAVPLGLDEEQNPQYLTSFRMPIEGLTSIPGGNSTDWYRDTVGNLQPALKTGISAITGVDPFTGREFGAYDKVMGEKAGAAGRAYNVIKGTGLLQPVTGLLDQAANWMDERKSVGQRVLQSTTGLRFTSVDPDLAKTQRIEDYLGANPDAKQYTGYFQEGADQGLSDLLKQLRESKERLKEKRKAAEAVM